MNVKRTTCSPQCSICFSNAVLEEVPISRNTAQLPVCLQVETKAKTLVPKARGRTVHANVRARRRSPHHLKQAREEEREVQLPRPAKNDSHELLCNSNENFLLQQINKPPQHKEPYLSNVNADNIESRKVIIAPAKVSPRFGHSSSGRSLPCRQAEQRFFCNHFSFTAPEARQHHLRSLLQRLM